MPEKLTKEQRQAMRHALGLDRKRKSYRNRYHAAIGSPDAEMWTELAALGCATLVHVEDDIALFAVTGAGRRALGEGGDRG